MSVTCGITVIGTSGIIVQASQYLDIKSTLHTTEGTALVTVAGTATKLPQDGGIIVADTRTDHVLFDTVNRRLKMSQTGEVYLVKVSFDIKTLVPSTYVELWLRGVDGSGVTLFDKPADSRLLLKAPGDTNVVSIPEFYYTGSSNLVAGGFDIYVRTNNVCSIWNIQTFVKEDKY